MVTNRHDRVEALEAEVRDLQAALARETERARSRMQAEVAAAREESRELASRLREMEQRTGTGDVPVTGGAKTMAKVRLPAGGDAASRYLDLLRACLTRSIFIDQEPLPRGETLESLRQKRANGDEFPIRPEMHAETMTGERRLMNVQECVETVIADAIPGDLMETGVWRGGSSILMRGVLAAYGDTDRSVWLADSFQGLPPPDTEAYPQDADVDLSGIDELAVSQAQVAANFERYGLLDERVHFLEGWFRDTLPTAPVDKLAVLRLDGDYYESTIIALESLYPKLSPGGFLIVDDFGAVPACAKAVHEFREKYGIRERIVEIDWTGVYWRRDRS